MFNRITRANELQTLTKHISSKCKCKFDGRKCNSDQWWNVNRCWCERKKCVCEKDYIWNPATYSCEHGKYLASIMNDSEIMCDKIIVIQWRNKNSSNKL